MYSFDNKGKKYEDAGVHNFYGIFVLRTIFDLLSNASFKFSQMKLIEGYCILQIWEV